MNTRRLKPLYNRSAKNVAAIAREYGYKLEIIHCGRYGKQNAYLSATNPSKQSPYGKSIESVLLSYDYCKRIYYDA